MSRLLNGAAIAGVGGTLICCVIPAVLVLLGFGSVLATVITNFPQITLFSENKGLVFIFSGSLLALSIIVRSRASSDTCPADPKLAALCRRSKKLGNLFLSVALLIYLCSFLFVYFY